MRPSKNVRIKTLRKHNPHDYLIERVELLGGNSEVDFIRNEECLQINLHNEPETDLPICFKIEIQ